MDTTKVNREFVGGETTFCVFEKQGAIVAVGVSGKGDVDALSAGALRDALGAALEMCGCNCGDKVIFDATNVEYLDSSGLGVLNAFLKKSKEKRVGLAVIVPDERIRRVFRITGFDKILDVFAKREEALLAL